MSEITPGLYDMPNDAYHAEEAWLSSSMLKRLLPEHYKTGGSQEALDFGTLFHTAVLEPDNLAGYVALDAEKIGVKADGTPAQNPMMTVAWKKAVAAAGAEGKTVIAQADLDRALAMRDAVASHETAAELLFRREGAAEESAFAIVDGVPCRARFDKRIPGVIVDLKSTSAKPGRESIRRAVIDYGYDLSAAHYLAVAQELGLDVQGFGLVFVGKEPLPSTGLHPVTVCDLDAAFLERGRVLRAKAIARHLEAEDAYEGATGFLTLDCPPWAHLQETA
jgi:hypothetical protein